MNRWKISFNKTTKGEQPESKQNIKMNFQAGYISLLAVLLVSSGCLNHENRQNMPEGNLKPTPSPGKVTQFEAWTDDGVQKANVRDNVSAVDGMGIVLEDKPVPIDQKAYKDTLFAAFKSEDLPGYDIFAITPGFLSQDSPKIIEVDYIGIRKDGNRTFLELVYKTNKAFDFDIGLDYSKDAGFSEVYPVTPSTTAMAPIISARETSTWQTASLEISPAMKEEFARIDLSIGYLGELDKNWRYGDQEFIWDERRISAASAGKIGEDLKSRFGVPKIRLLSYGSVLIEMSFAPPVLQREIIVVSENGIRMEGTIAITF